MDTQPETPLTPPPRRDPVALIRIGTIAFFVVAILVTWIGAANYHPAMYVPPKTEKPSRIAADTQTPLPIEESPSLPPTATETEPAIPTDESGLTIPPSFTPATNEVTPQPTSQTPGTIHPTATIGAPPENSLENPVPAGTSVEVGDGFILTIVGFTLPADSIVSAADPLSLPPAPGEEYLQVVVELTCTKPPAENCEFFTGELLALRPDGELYVPDTTITGIEEMLQDGRIQGGTSETGEQYYLIPKDDPSIVMYYESFLNPESDVYYLAFQ